VRRRAIGDVDVSARWFDDRHGGASDDGGADDRGADDDPRPRYDHPALDVAGDVDHGASIRGAGHTGSDTSRSPQRE